MRLKLALLISALILLAFPISARADGIIIPDPPICDPGPCPPIPPPPCPGPWDCPPLPPIAQLAIRYHRVTVAIQDQVAVTHVDQVFFNPNDFQIEGTYIFPLPAEAAVSAFTLWVDGKPVEGRILEANEARRIYEEIVRGLRDPALLEYADQRAVQARIFPIPPQGERRVELEYSQALASDNGLVRYLYPLGTEKFSVWPLEEVTINVDIRSAVPIRAVYSPTHNVAVDRQSDTHVSVGYEGLDIRPDADFALFYSLGQEQAFHLLSYRDPFVPDDRLADPDGFFMMLLAPRPDAAQQTLPKDVLLVLDRSGSMEGEKFLQAKDALRYILGHLNPEDRFNLIAFSTGLETYAGGLRPASEANEALPWVDRLGTVGSTDINRALLEAAAMVSGEKDQARPTYLIFITDGLPTEGEVESQRILDNLASAAPEDLRLFAFGVGYDVDTFLLDSLAQAHHGTSTYVLPDERLDEVLSAFYAKVSTPVMTDLELEFDGISAYDLYPSPLPDLFVGSQIIVVGRYREGGIATVTLNGIVNGQRQTFRYSDQHFATDNRASRENEALLALPRLWATRKIGYLLNQVRLHGPDQETIDQIVRLSIRYGIVTPYTSYLVTEEMPLGAAEQERIAGEQFNRLQASPTQPPSGQAAVEQAAGQGDLAEAEAPAAPSQEAANVVRIVGSRTFVLSDGVWVDTAFDPERLSTTRVSFLSDDYFALANARPELAAAFALGQRVIALSDGVAYEVVEEGEPTGPVEIPPALTTEPGGGVEPPQIDVQASPVEPGSPPSQPPSGGGLPCLGGMLPLALLPLIGLLVARRK